MDDNIIRLFGVFLTLATAGGVGYGLVAIGYAISKRIEGGARLNDDELAFLRDQAEEVEALRERLTELEERVDFAERMLPSPGSREPATSDSGEHAA